MLLRSNLTPAEVERRCKTRRKWRPYTYLNGVSVSRGLQASTAGVASRWAACQPQLLCMLPVPCPPLGRSPKV